MGLGSAVPRCIALAAALALAPPAFAQNALGDLLKKAGDAIKGQPQQQPNANLLPQARGMQVNTQIPPNLMPLFAKGTVNGEELIGTLRELQRLMRERKAALELAVLVGAADSSVNAVASGNFDVTKVFKEQAIQAALKLTKQVAANAANQALDQHMRAILDDSNALSAETITLPSPIGLQAKQAKRIVTMAALVVGARVSNKMLERAQKDMESLRKDYKDLIDRREKAAALLFAAISAREKAVGLNEALSAEDMKFIDKDLGKLSVRDFAKDMSAQNLALNYLRKVQPEAFAAYRSEADDVVLRTKAYIRTMTGIAAFGAISASFAQNIAEVAHEKQFFEFLAAMPLAFDFLRAAAPLINVTIQTATSGLALSTEGSAISNIFSRKRNFIYAQGDKSTEESSAKDVFNELGKSGDAAELFKGALFRSDSPGLLQRVGECDQAEAGRMLDATLSKDEREEFASNYFDIPDIGPNFSFYAALDSPGPTEREQLLAAQMLANDYRERATLDAKPIAKIQLKVSAKYTDWSDAQLMRLIFANKETPARYATLYVGESRIKPFANADSLYAYETAAESCKKLLLSIARVHAPPVAAAASAVKQAVKPALKPPVKLPIKKDNTK